MRFAVLLLPIATACAEPYSPYAYCKGDYEPLDADEVTSFGYSAQEAIDRHGLSHTGAITWERFDPQYTGPLPPDTEVGIDLEVGDIRWGRYHADTGNLLIYVECPEEGLEIDVTGTVTLADLGLELPVEGQMVASNRDAPPPPIEALGFGVHRDLRGAEIDPFLPAIDGFAEYDGFEYERVEPRLNLRVSADEPNAGLQVTWYLQDAVMDAGLPWNGVLTLAGR